MTRLVSLLLLFAAVSSGVGAEPRPKPRHDPTDQLFRRAPMAESARSIVVNLATNLHYAFDADQARVHTVWAGGPLNLWGPPYSYSKTPFICDFSGKVLYSFPQVSPWWERSTPLKTRFRSVSTLSNEVTMAYDVLLAAARVTIEEKVRGVFDESGWRLQRSFLFPHGSPEPLDFLAFAEANATATIGHDQVFLRGTNGPVVLTPPQEALIVTNTVAYDYFPVTESGTENGLVKQSFSGPETRVFFSVPASTGPFRFNVLMEQGSGSQISFDDFNKTLPPFLPENGDRRAKGCDEF
jgi:hypothetical protein